jgi:hypothetical protein
MDQFELLRFFSFGQLNAVFALDAGGWAINFGAADCVGWLLLSLTTLFKHAYIVVC